MDYNEFLKNKRLKFKDYGFEISKDDVNPLLFDFQRDIVKWTIRKGRCSVFLDTGLGKTYIAAEFARLTGRKTLMLAPLSVARQTVKLAKNINIEIRYIRSASEITDDHNIYISNYEMIDHFDFSIFGTIICDESSLFKSLAGKIRKKLVNLCRDIPYRLCCTATPAPNDLAEIGNHAEFLGICTHSEMLSMFFIHANIQEEKTHENGMVTRKKLGNRHGQEWRIKNHAYEPFYKWMASWSISMTKPSDLGYNDNGFILPPLNTNPLFIESETDYVPDGELFFAGVKGFKDAAKVKRFSANDRLHETIKILDNNDGQFIIWCWLQSEADLLKKTLQDCIEVRGDDSPEYKAQMIEDFQDGKYRVLITKPKIAGFGMNFQNAHNMIFFSLSHSWEMYYQCVRRMWRFGQSKPVNVWLLISEYENDVYNNIQKKEKTAANMKENLIKHIRLYEEEELGMTEEIDMDYYEESQYTGANFKVVLGDSCEKLKEIADNTVHLTVYSPPFADLYTYSPSNRDLGNSLNWDEFFEHYSFIIGQLNRITKPGRLSCVHVSDIPAMAVRDGYIGVKDFPGRVIQAHEKEGWIFTGRAFVQKNPQSQAIRTKSKALLFTQLRKDSSDSRPALIDQILIFKKNGENEKPIRPVENGEMDNETWIAWAHGIWLGISESDVLKYASANHENDEKHICPLQLGTIERCIKLYSNPGEIVLTPFLGIGSEVYQAIRYGRKGIGIELKKSYFNIAVNNCKFAEHQFTQQDLFSNVS